MVLWQACLLARLIAMQWHLGALDVLAQIRGCHWYSLQACSQCDCQRYVNVTCTRSRPYGQSGWHVLVDTLVCEALRQWARQCDEKPEAWVTEMSSAVSQVNHVSLASDQGPP